MDKRVKVPIRIRASAVEEAIPSVEDRERGAARPAQHSARRPPGTSGSVDGPAQPEVERLSSRPAPGAGHEVRDTKHAAPGESEASEQTDWRDRALRLQAEIENYRKRQQRLAEERIHADRERLLRSFLRVADDLERALKADGTDAESLRQGVGLTHQALMRVLEQEGAEPIEAMGQPFDPAWHEAVGALPHQRVGVEPDTVVEVVEAGYRLGDRLLRPARVIVAT